jgi:L-lysine 6-transaminase
MVTDRVDDVADNVFRRPSRINSTWGGNIGDMARCAIILETIRDDRLVENAAAAGAYLLEGLQALAAHHGDLLTNVRGRGLMCAFDLPDADRRRDLLKRALEERLVLLPCGKQSVRCRPALNITAGDIAQGLEMLGRALAKCS